MEAVSTRALPPRFAGFNTPLMWDIPYEDPRFRPLVAGLRPALLRFPGGTIANYWNPKSGRTEPGADMIGAFAVGARKAPELHPMGAGYEDFAAFSRACGAEVILVLNLETSPLEEQVAWVKRLVAKGAVPLRIEMGNEFYLEPLIAAGSGRPAKTPSQAAALEASRRMAEALRPIVPAAKIAVQSSGSRYAREQGPVASLMNGFDDALIDAPWFQAVTWHIYPEIGAVGGLGLEALGGATRSDLPEPYRSAGFLTASTAETALASLLGRVESGTRRHAQFLARKAPGKEVWVTEWGVGENIAFYRGERPVVTGLWIHILARQLMCLIREPNVTMALNHSIYTDGLAWSCIRREESERQYRAIGAYDLFRWFDEASNGIGEPVHVTELGMAGATARAALDDETRHAEMLALLFEKKGGRTLLVHNTGATAMRIALPPQLSAAKAAEALQPNSLLEAYSFGLPPIRPVAVAGGVLVCPPRSLVRVRV